MDLLQSIGKTPLIRLTKLTEGLDAEILVKVESRNPGGSIKDRAALCMIQGAIEKGILKPNGTIVEPTSGNTRHRLGGRVRLHGVQAYPDDAGIHE